MIFLFSRNGLPGSKLIRWGLDEPVSHFAMSFDESPTGYGIVFHAHFTGVTIEWFEDWQNRNEIVYAFTTKSPLELNQEERIYQVFARRFYGRPYDNIGMAFWIKTILEHKLLGKPIPTENKWGDPMKYLCYEIYEGFNALPFLGLPKVAPNEMITPYQLKQRLEKSPAITDISSMFRG